jgi:hypothetical protein
MDKEKCPCESHTEEYTFTIVTETKYGREIHTETIRATVDPEYIILDDQSDLGG